MNFEETRRGESEDKDEGESARYWMSSLRLTPKIKIITNRPFHNISAGGGSCGNCGGSERRMYVCTCMGWPAQGERERVIRRE